MPMQLEDCQDMWWWWLFGLVFFRRPRPRLEDVAAEVGVSTAAVSLVLRGAAGPSAATRERVLEAAARLGYRPDRAASLLARRRRRLIGVMLDVRSSYA